MWQVCRTCLKKVDDTSDIISLNVDYALRDQLYLFVPELAVSSIIDPIICGCCVKALNSVYDFKYRCLQSEAHIRSCIPLDTEHINLCDIFNDDNDEEETKIDIPTNDDDVSDSGSATNWDRDPIDTSDHVNVPSPPTEPLEADVIPKNSFILTDATLEDDFISTDATQPNVSERPVPTELIKAATCSPSRLDPQPEFFEADVSLEESFTSTGIPSNVSKAYDPLAVQQTATPPLSILPLGPQTNLLANATLSPSLPPLDPQMKLLEDNMMLEEDFTSSATRFHPPTGSVESVSLSPPPLDTNCVLIEEKPILPLDNFTKNKDGFYICPQCNKSFKVKKYLKKHLYIHSGLKPFKCDLCDYKCAWKTSLEKHMVTHTKEKPFMCDTCGYRAAIKSALQKHLRIHTGVRKAVCKICGASFIETNYLTRHMAIHNPVKSYICDKCNFRTNTIGSYRAHCKTHSEEKPYKCSICDYSGRMNIHLQKHMKMHSGEKNYECNECDFKTAHKSSLKFHQMKYHTHDAKYQCEFCSYKTSRKQNFEIHLLVHGDEKPYSCYHCDFKTTGKYRLVNHLKTHSKDRKQKKNKKDTTGSCSFISEETTSTTT